jgi:AhpD family alkylhydroperoxidase
MSENPVDVRALQRGLGALGRDLPGAMGAFTELHKATMRDGALPAANKELMALAIGIAQGCSGCIAYHGTAALKAGATRDEYLEAVGVAILMGGGPASVHAVEANAVLAQHQQPA